MGIAPHWRNATVGDTHRHTWSARTLHLEVDGWGGHVAGQHLDVRLTAPDGYQATRGYSLSSAAGAGPEITVERADGGEVSPYLVDVAEPGDRMEVRGPLGAYFVWEPDLGPDPLLLIAGGSGIAPLNAIWRTARSAGRAPQLLYTARTRDRLIFADQWLDTPGVEIYVTRERVAGLHHGRIGRPHVEAYTTPRTRTYVCGPTDFVEDLVRLLLETGQDPDRLRTERFG